MGRVGWLLGGGRCKGDGRSTCRPCRTQEGHLLVTPETEGAPAGQACYMTCYMSHNEGETAATQMADPADQPSHEPR